MITIFSSTRRISRNITITVRKKKKRERTLYDILYKFLKLKFFNSSSLVPALSKRMIARIFSGAVTRGGVKSGNGVQQSQDKMSYTEFVWFLLSEEDKNHPTAIEYWFRYIM